MIFSTDHVRHDWGHWHALHRSASDASVSDKNHATVQTATSVQTGDQLDDELEIQSQTTDCEEEDVTRIGDNAFKSNATITSVDFPDTITYIGSYAFHYCSSITSLNLPKALTYIDCRAFEYCYNVTDLVLPSHVSRIEYRAFYTCYRIAGTVTIPSSVSYLGGSVFENCYALEEVIINAPATLSSAGIPRQTEQEPGI